MSFRHHHAAAAALLFVSLSGMSLAVPAADTKPLVPQNCAQPVHVAKRAVSGHPGKSIQFPRRVVRSAGHCHAGKSEPLVLVGFTDARGGVSLERGNLERVIERVNARRFGRLSAAELTNLCVAQTATNRLELARNSCDEAVARSVADRDGLDRRSAPREWRPRSPQRWRTRTARSCTGSSEMPLRRTTTSTRPFRWRPRRFT